MRLRSNESKKSAALGPASVVLTVAAILAGGGTAASAADDQAATQDSPSSSIQEVVVTATKRSTTLQTTPISIAAISGDDLMERGVPDIAALINQTAGVSFQSVGPGRTNFNIRGLSDTGGASPTVGFYLDDVPITPATSAMSVAGKSEISPDLYDLERVEVLRGPQGTLYGSGSEGGTIRLLTNQPKLDKIEASAQAIASHTERSGGVNYTVNGMVNLPIIDNQLALRLVASERYYDGYIDRVVVSPFPQYTNDFATRGDVAAAPVASRYNDVNTTRSASGRAVLLWQPTDNLKVTPSVLVQNIHQGGQNSYDLPPGNFAHYQAGDLPEEFNETFSLFSLSVKYDWDAVSLQSTTSNMHVHFFNAEDVSEQWYAVFVPVGEPFLTDGIGREWHNQRQFSEEVRLASRGDGPLQWLLGGYYNNFKDTTTFYEGSPQLVPWVGDSNGFTDYEPDHLRQSAVFGEVTYAVLPNLKATAGLRYFHYSYDFLQVYSGVVTAPPYSSSGRTAASGNTPKFGLTYLPTPDLTLFANAAKGFRPGSANLPIPPDFCGTDLQALGVATYKPDTVWSYEVGEKARLLDGRVGVRGSAYYIDWKDIQTAVPLACGYSYTGNAGAAVSKGGELEIDAKLGPKFTVHQSVGYTDAKITSSSVGSAVEVGSPLANVPKWTVATSVEFSQPLSNGWRLGIRADDQYISSEYDPQAQPYPLSERGAYNIINARIGLDMGKLSAYLFGSNLANRVAYIGFDRSEAANSSRYARVIPTVPRTFGIDLQYRF